MAAQGKVYRPLKNTYKGCRGCNARTAEPNCHMTCRVYLNFVDEMHKRKELERQDKNGMHNVFAYTQKKGGHYI